MEELSQMNQVFDEPPQLTEEMQIKLKNQDTRAITDFKKHELEKNALKNWDIFYKRNGTRFFKDR
jgi:methyltransferase-like protein 6